MRPLKSRDAGDGRKGTALVCGRVQGDEKALRLSHDHTLAAQQPRQSAFGHCLSHLGLSHQNRERSDMDWKDAAAIIVTIVVLTVALGGVWVIF
jgi:hypothetical protein